MLIPRYNNFKVILPSTILPNWLTELYTEILKDADLLKLYNGMPCNAISESLTGIDLPGIHMRLVEQQAGDMQGTGSLVRYWPKGMNNMKILDDNEMSLTFRHIDGFHNYFMMRQALTYMADDNAQSAQGEKFKDIGNIVVRTKLTDNWMLQDVYQNVTYSSLDGNKLSYSAQATENTFTVRCKFVYYYAEYYYKDKCVSRRMFNHNSGK